MKFTTFVPADERGLNWIESLKRCEFFTHNGIKVVDVLKAPVENKVTKHYVGEAYCVLCEGRFIPTLIACIVGRRHGGLAAPVLGWKTKTIRL